MANDAKTIPPTAPRMLPALNSVNRAFWTGGANSELLIQRCATDDVWVYPPRATCPTCQGELTPEPVAGTGTIFSFTVNHQAFHPDVTPPYVIAIVTLDEQDDLRLPTNLVNCDAETLECGAPVSVLFEQHDEVFVPVFEPLA